MERLKRTCLYRWFLRNKRHDKNGSSGDIEKNGDKGNDPNILKSVVCDGTTSTRVTDPSPELTPVEYLNASDSLENDPNILKSVVCVGTTSTRMTYVSRMSTIVEDLNESDSLENDPNILKSVVCDGTTSTRVTDLSSMSTTVEDLYESDSLEVTDTSPESTTVEDLNESDSLENDPNILKSVVCDGTTSTRVTDPSPELTPVEYLNASDSLENDPNILKSVVCDGTTSTRVTDPSPELTPVEYLNASDSLENDPNILKSVVCDGTTSTRVTDPSPELTPVEYLNASDSLENDPNILKSVVCDGTTSTRVTDPSPELTPVEYLNASDSLENDPNILKSVVCDGTTSTRVTDPSPELTPVEYLNASDSLENDPNILKSVVCDGTTSTRVTDPSPELTPVEYLNASDSLENDPNILKSVVCDGTTSTRVTDPSPELTPVEYLNASDSLENNPNILKSVVCDGTTSTRVTDPSPELTPVEYLNASDSLENDPNILKSVVCDGTTSTRVTDPSPEFTPVEYLNASDSLENDPNILKSVVCDGTTSTRVTDPSPELTPVEYLNASDLLEVTDPSPELTPVEYLNASDSLEVTDPSPELTPVEYLNASDSLENDPNILKSVVCDGTTSTRVTDPSPELTPVEYLNVSDSLENDPNILKSVVCDGTTSTRVTDPSPEFTPVEYLNASDSLEVTYLSSVYTTDEDINRSKIKRIINLILSSLTLRNKQNHGNILLRLLHNMICWSDVSMMEGHENMKYEVVGKVMTMFFYAKMRHDFSNHLIVWREFCFPMNCFYWVKTEIFGILLAFVDAILIMSDFFFSDQDTFIPLEYRTISLSIGLFFSVDILLRIYVEGIWTYFSDKLNSTDTIVIGVTLMIDFIYIFYDFGVFKNVIRSVFFFRVLRLATLIRIFHLAYQKRQLEKLARMMVSENKRRFQKDGFDLDLTYITDRIIAMSFPCSGHQSFYRNPIQEVARFLDSKHQDHYQLYNLCSEKTYDPKYFHYTVHRIMIDDHNVPTLHEMVEFSKEVRDWMNQDTENIVVIHCKGGKGRTGTMVCVCLIACEIFRTAKESLDYFGQRRTDRTHSTQFQGVETPSQSRYVGYFADVKNIYNLTLPPKKTLTIKKFVIYSILGVGKGDGSDLQIQMIMDRNTVFSCSASKNCEIVHDIEGDNVAIYLSNCPILYDDVKVKFLSSNLPKYYDNCAFFFWFNTSFIINNRLFLSRDEVDNAHKSKAWKFFRPDFGVEIHFDDIL